MNTVLEYSQQKTVVNKVAILLAILVSIRIRPYYLWPYEEVLRPLCAVVIMGISLLNFSKEKYNILIFLLLVAAYVWASLFVDNSPIITVLNFIGFAFIPLIKKDLVLETYVYFKNIFGILLFLCIVDYVLTLLGISFSLGSLQYENGPQTITFIKHPFYILTFENSYAIPRFNAVFDEPGVVGTICGLMLLCERMRFNNKLNIVLLIGGILSMSFYFYMSVLFGMILFSVKSHSTRRWMFLLAVLVAISFEIPQMYDTIWSRFEWDAEKGSFVGDNRQDLVFTNFWDTIKGTPLMITGVGAMVADEYIGASASLLVVIAKHGLLFVVPIILSFVILAYREFQDKKLWIAFIVFFILTLYQRPGFYSTYSMALYTMVIYQFANLISQDEKKDKNISCGYYL